MTTWKAAASFDVKSNSVNGGGGGDDDWETDPDFVNDVTEEEQRWGSKTVEGSGRSTTALNMSDFRAEVKNEDAEFKKKEMEVAPKASFGYGGKFGVQKDRMDKSAVGHDYIAHIQKHGSQTDSVKGFGGKYGVQADRQDKSALGWDHHEKVEKHTSQRDYVSGFGGKFGLQTDRVDKSAVGWDYQEKTEKHESQMDYTKGFGGKFGIQSERQDSSAVGWEYHEKTEKHSSQKDYAQGFGGKYGVQADRKDKSAHGWDELTKTEAHPSQTDMKHGFGGKFGVQSDRQDKSAFSFTEGSKPQPSYDKPKLEGGSAKASSLRAKFENLAKAGEEEAKKRAEEERVRRLAKEQREREDADKAEQERQKKLSLREEEEKDLNVEENVEEEEEEPSYYRSNPAGRIIKGPQVLPTLVASQPPPVVPQPTQVIENLEDIRMPPPQAYASDFLEPVAEESDVLESKEQEYNDTVYEEAQDEEAYDDSEESGLSAIALYDYQAADSDEISFDPDDIITNIEMIDEGWWRGECRGQLGLFPANYVQLTQE